MGWNVRVRVDVLTVSVEERQGNGPKAVVPGEERRVLENRPSAGCYIL